MRAMILQHIASLDQQPEPLQLVDLPVPKPAAGEVLVRVSVCGVCHTELDEIEGRTPPPRLPVVPGHQIVGRVESLGAGASAHEVGARVGIGWIHSSDGTELENLSAAFRATGRDVNGGYEEFVTVPEDYAYLIPDEFSDEQAAPLLCAGAVGYRALNLANIHDGDALGLMGFGGSNHLVLQIARHLYPASPIHVFARNPTSRQFALTLGAKWAGGIEDLAPEPMNAIIDTTPAWTPIVAGLANLRPGGRLIVNAIGKEPADQEVLQRLDYQQHLWMEKEIKSVANVTQHDLRDFLPLAAAVPLQPKVTTYALEDANRALRELKQGGVQGAKVLVVE